MSFRWYLQLPPSLSVLPLPFFPFYFDTTYLDNVAKNMGDILRYITDSDFENLVIYKCPHFSCSLRER